MHRFGISAHCQDLFFRNTLDANECNWHITNASSVHYRKLGYSRIEGQQLAYGNHIKTERRALKYSAASHQEYDSSSHEYKWEDTSPTHTHAR